jgi:hypothetical protein
MLVHLRVRLAFLRTDAAGDGAGVQLGAKQLRVGLGLPHQQARRSLANVRAVEVGPEAPYQFLHLLLSKAGVGAGSASVSALYAGIYAACDYRQIGKGLSWVSTEHLLCFHVVSPVFHWFRFMMGQIRILSLTLGNTTASCKAAA